MSQTPSTTASSSNYQAIFGAALKEYKIRTGKDIADHPLSARIQSCNSPDAILAILQEKAHEFGQSISDNKRLTKWLNPTVNVLYAFSATLGEGVGLVFSPAKVIFAGIGVLLLAAKDVEASQGTLLELFDRIGSFFRRLETYIEVSPSDGMRDMIVKIMVEVLCILTIATREIKQGRTKKYFKKLVGRTDIEDALQRLDRLTQEEARMATAQVLKVTQKVDGKVDGVGDRVQLVENTVNSVDDKVEIIDGRVQGIGDRVKGVDEKVQIVDGMVQGVDDRMRIVGDKVNQIVDEGKATRVSVQKLANDLGYLSRIQILEKLRNWLCPPDPSINYNTARSTHHEGTAQWFTNGETFIDWKASGSLLWIHGKPGSGKSILSSAIIHNIEAISNAGSALMAYFYFDFKDTGKQDPRALLSSLLIQLCNQSDIYCDILVALYSIHHQGSKQPGHDALIQCLQDMLTVPGQIPTYLIMDALDECPNSSGIPSARERVLELVERFLELNLPNLRLCITSRPEIDIRTSLDPVTSHRVSLHDENGQKDDIIDYVSSVVYSDRKMRRWRDEDKTLVIEALSDRADGMFRWVFCQLEILRHCLPPSVRRILDELPESLDETYERVLKEINKANREHAYRLLQCLTAAVRPLSVEELAEVLAVDFNAGGIPKLNVDWRWEDQEQAVLSACSSLIAVIDVGGSQVVQFSHFSVKEFLTSDRLAASKGDVSNYHIRLEPAHTILAQACLGVLLRLDDKIDKESIKSFPLVQYSAENWLDHAQFEGVYSHIEEGTYHLFDAEKPHLSAFLWVRSSMTEIHPERLETVPLYYAAEFGFLKLVEGLITKHPEDLNATGGEYGNPLLVAMHGSNKEVSWLLLERGADVNYGGWALMTPLHVASARGLFDIAQWLLNHGADPSALDEHHCTSLHIAASVGNSDIIQILLERNVGVDSRRTSGQTPLHKAAEQSALEPIRLLLEHGADPNAQDGGQSTPLHEAASRGYLQTVQLLLDHGANVHLENENGATPFQVATKEGHDKVAQLLSENGGGGQKE